MPYFAGELGSVGLYRVSLSYCFARNAHVGSPMHIWRRLARVVGAAR
jgi:hypothetical protein